MNRLISYFESCSKDTFNVDNFAEVAASNGYTVRFSRSDSKKTVYTIIVSGHIVGQLVINSEYPQFGINIPVLSIHGYCNALFN